MTGSQTTAPDPDDIYRLHPRNHLNGTIVSWQNEVAQADRGLEDGRLLRFSYQLSSSSHFAYLLLGVMSQGSTSLSS
jgi:hypothetical protein